MIANIEKRQAEKQYWIQLQMISTQRCDSFCV